MKETPGSKNLFLIWKLNWHYESDLSASMLRRVRADLKFGHYMVGGRGCGTAWIGRKERNPGE